MKSAQFYERLREARAGAGQSIRGLAAAADVSQETVRLLQNGGRCPGIDTTERLADALGVTPQWLAYGIE